MPLSKWIDDNTWVCSHCNLTCTDDWCKLCGRVPMKVWDQRNASLFKRIKDVPEDPDASAKLKALTIRLQKENKGENSI